MQIILLLNLLLFVIHSLGQDETELQCSVKPGCQITQCDPLPPEWNGSDANMDEYFRWNEFPITCVNKNAEKSQNSVNLLPLIIGNVRDIRNVESNLKNIEKKADENAIEIQELSNRSTEADQLREEIMELQKLNENRSLEIERLRNKTVRQFKMIRQLQRNQSSQMAEQTKKLKNLRRYVMEFNLNHLDWYKAGNGQYYKLFHDFASYTTAKKNCRKFKGRLASAGMRDYYVRRELMPLLKAGNDETWIGLNDIKHEGTFYWEDGVKGSKNSVLWKDGQPDNWKGGEDCAEIGPEFNWKLNDDGCHYLNKYLCEIEI